MLHTANTVARCDGPGHRTVGPSREVHAFRAQPQQEGNGLSDQHCFANCLRQRNQLGLSRARRHNFLGPDERVNQGTVVVNVAGTQAPSCLLVVGKVRVGDGLHDVLAVLVSGAGVVRLRPLSSQNGAASPHP